MKRVAARLIVLAGIGAVFVASVGHAQSTPPKRILIATRQQSVPEDRATLAKIAAEYPCRGSLPASWTISDTTLRTGARCSLVVAAAAAIRQGIATGDLPSVDLEHVACVRVSSFVFRNMKTGKIDDPYWSVEFYGEKEPWARAIVHRVGGKIDAIPYYDEFLFGAAKMCGLSNRRRIE